MSIKKVGEIIPVEAKEGTKIKQIFHPHNTLNGIRYSISQCIVEPGKKSNLHKMTTSEIYYILDGDGILHIDDESFQVSKDQAVYISPHSKQQIVNTGKIDLKILCIVDPAWRQEDEIILE